MTTTTTTYWTNDNGRVVCHNHLGNYGTAELASNPKTRKLHTPMGTWEKMTGADLAYWVEFITTLNYTEACEDCRWMK
jgi:hypothetical protein